MHKLQYQGGQGNVRYQDGMGWWEVRQETSIKISFSILRLSLLLLLIGFTLKLRLDDEVLLDFYPRLDHIFIDRAKTDGIDHRCIIQGANKRLPLKFWTNENRSPSYRTFWYDKQNWGLVGDSKILSARPYWDIPCFQYNDGKHSFWTDLALRPVNFTVVESLGSLWSWFLSIRLGNNNFYE